VRVRPDDAKRAAHIGAVEVTRLLVGRDARTLVGRIAVASFAAVSSANDAKGIALVIAMSLEILAVALVGAAVGFVLWD
jgi:hypothetical protein